MHGDELEWLREALKRPDEMVRIQLQEIKLLFPGALLTYWSLQQAEQLFAKTVLPLADGAAMYHRARKFERTVPRNCYLTSGYPLSPMIRVPPPARENGPTELRVAVSFNSLATYTASRYSADIDSLDDIELL
ncbi:hypothetical protein PM082_008541 [Marasmius tenuissimus]|nr:hypothetical protein PM082_008541 [Marasmius tenuissimus]